MKEFLLDYSGKAVGGLALTAGLITFPAIAVWVAAAITLIFSLENLRAAYARMEAAEQEADDLKASWPASLTPRRRLPEDDPRYWPPVF